MKKAFLKIILFCMFQLLFLGVTYAAGAVNIPGTSEIQDVSISFGGASWDLAGEVRNIGLYRVLPIVKVIIMWLLVIYLVYTGAMMIMSMGSDEEQLSASKRHIWYSLVALVFINIPGSIYQAFYKDGTQSIGDSVNGDNFTDAASESAGNIIFNFSAFGQTFAGQIVMFLEIMIFIAAVVMITIAGIQLMTSRWREEKLKEAKNKILYTVLALIFVGIIEAWKNLAFGGVIEDGKNLLETLSNLALFFAAPVAIFFLTLAGYYYITSNGDEERIKKAKSIIVNTFLATLILLAAYTFLLDLATL